MIRIAASVGGFAAFCSAALAQFAGGVNIDFNTPTGAGAGQPTILFSGAAAQGGYWNPVNGPYGVGATFTIRNLANSADALTLRVEGTNNLDSYTFNNANTSGDAELLLDDIFDVGVGGHTTLSIGPFAGGVYDVYTYAVAPDNSAARMSVSAHAAPNAPGAAVTVGGAIPVGGALTAGVTHCVHRLAVAGGERIWIEAQATTGAGSLNGIQIKPVTGYTRLYVRQDAPVGTQTGLSWADACTELQRALSIAGDNPAVTEIWLTRGLHYPDRVFYPDGSRSATFTVPSNVLLLGRFNGTEATPADRVPGGSATQLNGRGFARHVVTISDATNVRLEDLNINDGNNDLPLADPVGGAAVRIINSSATFSSNRFGSNSAGDTGGGVFSIDGASNVTINDASTLGNRAGIGSFLYAGGGTVTINRSRIGNNTGTGGSGGVIDATGSATVILNNCLIANNQHYSWIIDASTAARLELHNCTLANNRSTSATNVGVAAVGGSIITNSIIYGNASNTGTPTMAGVLRFGGPATVYDSIVQQWDGSLAPTGNSNFDADPRFTFPQLAGLLAPGDTLGAGQYQLASRSPARDSGWNTQAPAGGDINGSPRIVDDPIFPNTGFAGGTIDRGCAEAQTSSLPCPADIGSTGGVLGADGLRDNNDFVVFINEFFLHHAIADVGRTGGIAGADGAWDNNDFVVFIDMFFQSCP